MKVSSVVGGSHFINESQCITKLSQLSKMEDIVGIINEPGLETTPRKAAICNLCVFLVIAFVVAWFFFPFQTGKKEAFILVFCLFIIGLLIREIVVAPDSYLDSLFNELEKYKPLDMNTYLQYGIGNQIESKQLNISATRRWIIKEKKSVNSYMDRNNFSYDDDED